MKPWKKVGAAADSRQSSDATMEFETGRTLLEKDI